VRCSLFPHRHSTLVQPCVFPLGRTRSFKPPLLNWLYRTCGVGAVPFRVVPILHCDSAVCSSLFDLPLFLTSPPSVCVCVSLSLCLPSSILSQVCVHPTAHEGALQLDVDSKRLHPAVRAHQRHKSLHASLHAHPAPSQHQLWLAVHWHLCWHRCTPALAGRLWRAFGVSTTCPAQPARPPSLAIWPTLEV